MSAGPGRDEVRPVRPFTPPDLVLPIFVCFRFPNGASYAGSLDTFLRFNPKLVAESAVSVRPQREALRWVMES